MLGWLGMSARTMLVQAVCGAALCALMVDALMFADEESHLRSPDLRHSEVAEVMR